MASSSRPTQNPLVCHGHTRPIVELAFSAVTPDGYFLTSASKDGQPMLRNGETGDWIGTFQGHKGAVWSCVLDAPALRAATASADFSARVWDAVSGNELAALPHAHIVRTVAFTPDSRSLITAGYEKVIRLYARGAPGAPPTDVAVADDKVRHAAFTADGGLLLTTSIDAPGVSLWDLRTRKVVGTLATEATVTSVDVCPGGRRLVTADGREAKVWDAASRSLLRRHPFEFGVESASLSEARNRLAVGGEDMWVHVLDAETGAEVDCSRGHHGPVHTVRFAPGGAAYASGSEDGTIRIWETEWAGSGGNGNGGAAAAAALQPAPVVAA